MTLGERIKELRQAARISQIRLSEKSGVSRIVIAKLELNTQHTTTWQTVARLARSFGLTIPEFLQDVDEDMGAAAA